MKRLLTLILSLLPFISAYSQQTLDLNFSVVAEKKIPGTKINAGDAFVINSVECTTGNKKGLRYFLNVSGANGAKYRVDLSKSGNVFPISCNTDNPEDYWHYRAIKYSLPALSKMSNAYSYRSNAEKAANEYLRQVQGKGVLIEDSELTDYINSLIRKIDPGTRRVDFFNNYTCKAIVVKNDFPNASMSSTGLLIINSGNLARMHTEDELVALICHEYNHYICNHYLELQARTDRKELAAAIIGTIFHDSNTKNIINDIGSRIIEYDQSQEKESDEAAMEMAPMLGYDRQAWATALKICADYLVSEGDMATYNVRGSHPKLEERLAIAGNPFEKKDSEFEKKVASCIRYSSEYLFVKHRYSQALEMVQENIDNGIARATDYYIKGECLIAKFNDEKSNLAAEEALFKVFEMVGEDPNATKALEIVEKRLGRDESFTKRRLEEIENRVWREKYAAGNVTSGYPKFKIHLSDKTKKFFINQSSFGANCGKGLFIIGNTSTGTYVILDTLGVQRGKISLYNEWGIPRLPYFSGKGLSPVKLKDGSFAIINTSGKITKRLPNAIDISSRFVDGIALAKMRDPKSGITVVIYINETGEHIFPDLTVKEDPLNEIDVDKVYPSINGLRKFYDSVKGKYGYMNAKGKITIAAQYDNAHNFSDGLAAVLIDGDNPAWGFINSGGELVIPPTFMTEPGDFHNGYALVTKKNERKVFIDKDAVVRSEEYLKAVGFMNGLAIVNAKDEYGDDGSKGIIINEHFEMTGKIEDYFSENTKYDEKHNLFIMNKIVYYTNGRQKLDPNDYGSLQSDFDDNVALFSCKKFTGIINTSGEVLVYFEGSEF